MKKGFVALAVVFMLLFASFAADARVIMIHNGTGFDLYAIHISDSGYDDWEEDLLGNDILEAGESLRVTVHGGYEYFDLLATDMQGTSVAWFELPGNASRITIYADGTAAVQ